MKPLLLAALLVARPVWAVEVPSGQPVTLQEVLVDAVGAQTFVRFRFVTPDISRADGQVDHEAAALDMQYLCDEMALPYLAEFSLEGDVIVVSLADRETEFGVADPEATQFFEAFRVQDDSCIWEGF